MSWDTHEKPSTWQRLLQLQDGFNRSWRIEKATLPFPPLQKNSVKHYLISSLSLHLAWDSQCHSEQTLRPWSYLTTPTCGPFNIGNSAKCQNQHPARKRTVTTINTRSPLFPIGVYLWDHQVPISTTPCWPSTAKYQPLPPSTDPVPSYINQYHSILTQNHQVSTITALYWPSTIMYQSVLPYAPKKILLQVLSEDQNINKRFALFNWSSLTTNSF